MMSQRMVQKKASILQTRALLFCALLARILGQIWMTTTNWIRCRPRWLTTLITLEMGATRTSKT